MSDVAAYVAAVAAFLAADTTDVLAADTTDVSSAAKAASGCFSIVFCNVLDNSSIIFLKNLGFLRVEMRFYRKNQAKWMAGRVKESSFAS